MNREAHTQGEEDGGRGIGKERETERREEREGERGWEEEEGGEWD